MYMSYVYIYIYIHICVCVCVLAVAPTVCRRRRQIFGVVDAQRGASLAEWGHTQDI